MAVTVGPCTTPDCFTRTIGYWQTHGTQLSTFMSKGPLSITLWGQVYNGANNFSPQNAAPACSKVTNGYDFLWPLCQQGASECK